MGSAFDRFTQVASKSKEDRAAYLDAFKQQRFGDVSHRAQTNPDINQTTTALATDYQLGAMACFDGCSKMLSGCMDNMTMDAAIAMYRRLKGPLGGGLLGYDEPTVARNASRIGYDGGTRDLAISRGGSPAAVAAQRATGPTLPATPAVVNKLKQVMHVDKRLSKANSPEYNRGFMDTFNYIDQNLDKMMDDGSLESAFEQYKDFRRSQDPLYDLKRFFGAVETPGTFQDLVDIINRNKSNQQYIDSPNNPRIESRKRGTSKRKMENAMPRVYNTNNKKKLREGSGYTQIGGGFDFEDDDILYWKQQYDEDPENFSIPQEGAGEYEDQLDYYGDVVDDYCDEYDCQPMAVNESRKRKMREDFLDDYDDDEGVTNSRLNFKKDLRVSKNMLGNGKANAQKTAKGSIRYGKETGKWDDFDPVNTGTSLSDYSAYIRNTFISMLNFADRKNYQQVTVKMRQALGISKSDDGGDWEDKDNKRGRTARIPGKKGKTYAELDLITMAELTAYYLLDATDAYETLEDQDKIDICTYAAKAVKTRKIEDAEALEDVSDDILKDIEKKGFEVKKTPDINEPPYSHFEDPNYEDNYKAALGFTKDEIEKDTAERKAAHQRHNSRQRTRSDIADYKADKRKAKADKYWDAAFKSAGGDDVDKAVLDFYGAMSYANAGWDYHNVDHAGEEAAAYSVKNKAIENFGPEAWAKAVKKFRTNKNRRGWLVSGEEEIEGMDDYTKDYNPDPDANPFDVADERLAQAKGKYPGYFKGESRNRKR